MICGESGSQEVKGQLHLAKRPSLQPPTPRTPWALLGQQSEDCRTSPKPGQPLYTHPASNGEGGGFSLSPPILRRLEKEGLLQRGPSGCQQPGRGLQGTAPLLMGTHTPFPTGYRPPGRGQVPGTLASSIRGRGSTNPLTHLPLGARLLILLCPLIPPHPGLSFHLLPALEGGFCPPGRG